jgi:hypothetical protein
MGSVVNGANVRQGYAGFLQKTSTVNGLRSSRIHIPVLLAACRRDFGAGQLRVDG